MICLSTQKLTLAFGDNTILENISFSINEGDKLGIVGSNGAGKSTLFKLICREYTPTDGEVYVNQNYKVGVLKQNPSSDSTLSIYEEVLTHAFSELIAMENRLEQLHSAVEAGDESALAPYSNLQEKFALMGGYEYRSRAQGILVSLGFPKEYHTTTIDKLSGGQKTRVELAALLASEPDILMLDEPTNHLDIEALKWLEDFLSSYTKTVLVISHDRYFLDRVTTHTLDIENTHAKLYKGNYSQFKEKKKKDNEVALHHYKNQQREIKRIEEYIAQQKRWNRERNIIAAESRQKQLDKMERLEKPDAPEAKIRFSFNFSGEGANEVLTLRDISKSFGDNKLFDKVSFTVMKRDRVFITGANGTGKSTLIKIIAGKLKADNGGLYWGANTLYSYYDQENQNLTETKTVLDELWDAYPLLSQTVIRNTLAVFRFYGEDVIKPVSALSGGEKARLTLAKILLSKMNVLILDEPTNHLDINSREALEEALCDFEGTIIAVSHDRYFIDKLANRILAFNLEEQNSLFDYRGSYKEFEEYKKRFAATVNISVSAEKTSSSKEDRLAQKKAQSEKRRLQKQYENAVKRSAELEELIDKTDKQMEEVAADHIKLAELYTLKEDYETELLEAYEIIENYESED